MLYVTMAIDPLPSACDNHGCEAISAMGFPPWYVCNTEKFHSLSLTLCPGHYLTWDVGLTPLYAQLGREWEQSIGSHYQEGMALTLVSGALVACQQSEDRTLVMYHPSVTQTPAVSTLTSPSSQALWANLGLPHDISQYHPYT